MSVFNEAQTRDRLLDVLAMCRVSSKATLNAEERRWRLEELRPLVSSRTVRACRNSLDCWESSRDLRVVEVLVRKSSAKRVAQ